MSLPHSTAGAVGILGLQAGEDVKDLVARESIKGASWAGMAAPKGRRPGPGALSGAQRQKRFRERHQAQD